MSMKNNVENIRKLHPSTVILMRVGRFYKCFDKDAYILSHLFDYKVLKDNYIHCGFPTSSINKIRLGLENEKISYIEVDRRLEYEVLSKEDFKKENRYNETYEIAKNEFVLKVKIAKINKYLIDNISNAEVMNKIKALERLIYADGTV